MLDELLELEEGLSAWEMDFIDSLDRSRRTKELTEKQRDRFMSIVDQLL